MDNLNDDDLVAPLVCLGSGKILTEKNYNYSHFVKLFEKIEINYGRRIDVVVALSIGGGAIFSPLFLTSFFNTPILDADCFGRTLPYLQMMSTNLAGILPKKAFISNVMGDVVEIECDNFRSLERYARQLTVSSGGICTIIPQVLTGEEAKRGLIPGSLTKALTIGKIIQETRDLNAVMEYAQGVFVGVGGVVTATGLGLPEPFKRRIVLRNIEAGKIWEVWMDNEFNLLLENGKVIAEVPDIITLCDPSTCEPLNLNQVVLGANVAICTMKAPDVWYTEKGLALVRTEVHRRGCAAIPSLEMLEHVA